MLVRRPTRALAPLGIGFFFLILSALAAILLSIRQEAAVAWVRHTLEVQTRLNLVRSLITEAESGRRGFLLTGRDVYLEPYQRAILRLPRELDTLEGAVADNAVARRNMERMRPAIQAKLNELGASVALVRLGRRADAVGVLQTGAGQRHIVEARAAINDMMQEEKRLLAIRATNAGWISMASRLALFFSALLVIVLAYFVVRDARRRIVEVEKTNEHLREEVQQRQLAQSQVRQLQKMEAVGQLTGGIAHDFNNMLAIVIGSLDMARRRLTGGEDAKLVKCIDAASEGAERAATLTGRLLAFSRRQPLQPKVLDTNKLVGSMSELLRRTLGERVAIETVLAGGLWRICADPAQLESTLVNLAVNARDAMPDGGKLTIETANTELDERYAQGHEEVSPGQYVMLSLTDTGTGMSPEVIERAFEPFYTTKGVGRGTGLGLSQIFGFVKQSQGHVKIYSEVGQGTTVKLYLPRHAGELPDEAVKASRGDIPAGQVEEIILVVEDDERVRHMSVDALRELGYTVIQAADGNQALEQLAIQPRIDLLFTDIVMPGMTGRQLADRAQEARPDLKILYTTGYTRNAVVHNGIVDYGVAFLAKPFSIDALARKVRDILDG
ncbi:CHASE3 domain-containing protein [Sphingosinicella rhizophila]|uniref:histidine kinase n=1 Tax=Sphingosinicella rhizophila TaxID=3050082 RepID=A0ABU3Q948_9SPHN|nr:CHASE3 domain-containing protein [Sphingosinicella sp. GR2756]MDT9599931.1 CHASE3 domain-containing protein [Sphingosinicella sp. GR2756]